MADSVFKTLNSVNCNEHTEKKNGLTYLPWAWAWAEVKKRYPLASYTVYENGDGWNYFTDGRTCWVKTGVTIEGQELVEYLPVMDFRNASIPADKVTSFDVNKAIQRSLTKAAARHGLGLYIYAGEDLPEDAPFIDPKQVTTSAPRKAPKPECPEEVWYKLVKMEVEGLKTKSGLSPLQFLASKYHTDQLILVKFNNDVQMSRDAKEENERNAK